MSQPTTTTNFSIHAIPIAYMLAFPPHLYEFARGMTASNYTTTNLVPRTNLETLKTKLPASTWQSLARARGCHLNALEGFPLFASAMIIGNYAKLPSSEMNSLAAQYLGARVVYSVLYMTVKTEAASYLRTAAYAWGLSIPLYVLWKAGNRLV